MPCLKESEEKDVALEILDIVTPRHNIGDPQVIRELTQTDRLNKVLLNAFRDRMTIVEPVKLPNSNNAENNVDEFED